MLKKMEILVAFLSAAFALHASGDEKLEKVVLHEIVAKAYSAATFRVDVGGAVGKVIVDLGRDVERGSFLELRINYGKMGVVKVPRQFISCIDHPWIEYSTFYFTDLGDDAPAESWFSSIDIPFGPVDMDDEESSYVKINRFPAIEFEVTGGKVVSRIKIKKNENEVKVLKDVNSPCPEQIIRWALQ